VYLHIGEPKTGTTFVQEAIWASRGRLAAQGVQLPGYSHRDHSRASRDLREAPQMDSDPADRWAGEWGVLTRQALLCRGAALISDELLVACTPRQADRGVQALLAAEVHVVATVRDIASLLPAEWQETVKVGGTLPWEQWFAEVAAATPFADRRPRAWFWTAHDTLANLGMWAQHIPPDHVHVVTLPRQGPPGALWARFASVLGVDPESVGVGGQRVNSSLGLVEAEFLRRMNLALPADMPAWFYTRNVKRVLALDALAGRPDRMPLVLSPDQQAWAREQSEILVAGLQDAKYHIVGDVADLRPDPAPGQHVSPASLAAGPLLDTAVHAAAALVERKYRELFPEPAEPEPPASARQRASKLKWTILNGSWTRHRLRNASHIAAVRALRVAIWRVLMRPARGGGVRR
jgi:hypothetical protein